MIIYGTRASHLKSTQLPNEVCPNCNTKGSMMMSVFNKYAHIFWIPFFPLGRKGASQCGNCQQVIEPKKMPPFLKLQYDQLAGETRIPVWDFAGLGLFAVLFVFFLYSTSVDKENELKYLAAPMAGDIYEMKTEDGYSIAKVEAVSGDSLFVIPNQYTVDRMAGLYKLNDKDWDTIGYWVPKKAIDSMYHSKEIIGINR